MTSTNVDDCQLLSTKKLFKKSTRLVMTDQRLLVGFIAASVGTRNDLGTHLILPQPQNLSINKVSAKWLPRMLSDVQKADQVQALTGLLRLFNENPDNFVTAGEI